MSKIEFQLQSNVVVSRNSYFFWLKIIMCKVLNIYFTSGNVSKRKLRCINWSKYCSVSTCFTFLIITRRHNTFFKWAKGWIWYCLRIDKQHYSYQIAKNIRPKSHNLRKKLLQQCFLESTNTNMYIYMYIMYKSLNAQFRKTVTIKS